MTEKYEPTQISRRTLLIKSAAVVGAASFGSLLAACGGAPAAAPAATSAPAAAAPTAAGAAAAPTAAAAAAAPTAAAAPKAPGQPLTVFSWSYHPEIIQENLKLYAQTYSEPPVVYQQAPATSAYLPLLTAKFMGGVPIDLAYVDESFANRLYKAGYIRALDDFPGVDDIKKGLFPVGLQALTGSDGKLIGLPYWSGPQQFVMHQGHMDKAGLKAPTTWEEFVDQCKTIKGKGVTKFPYLPMWVKSVSQMDWTLYAECYSEGDYVFDDDAKPAFKDGGVAFQKTLERWKWLWDNEMVPPDVFTVQNEGVQAYATGEFTFHWTHEYDQKVYNDPTQSKMAGMAKNIESPGKVKTTLVDSAMYSMGTKNTDPERAWTLLRWYGWRDPKTKEFNVEKKWALLFGLGTIIKDIANDPEVVADWKKWKDVDLYNKQMERGRVRQEEKQLWFTEWNESMMSSLQDAITGKETIANTIKALSDRADTLRDAYPKV